MAILYMHKYVFYIRTATRQVRGTSEVSSRMFPGGLWTFLLNHFNFTPIITHVRHNTVRDVLRLGRGEDLTAIVRGRYIHPERKIYKKIVFGTMISC